MREQAMASKFIWTVLPARSSYEFGATIRENEFLKYMSRDVFEAQVSVDKSDVEFYHCLARNRNSLALSPKGASSNWKPVEEVKRGADCHRIASMATRTSVETYAGLLRSNAEKDNNKIIVHNTVYEFLIYILFAFISCMHHICVHSWRASKRREAQSVMSAVYQFSRLRGTRGVGVAVSVSAAYRFSTNAKPRARRAHTALSLQPS